MTSVLVCCFVECTDSHIWRNDFGRCETYSSGVNHLFCEVDYGTENGIEIIAQDACPTACDTCVRGHGCDFVIKHWNDECTSDVDGTYYVQDEFFERHDWYLREDGEYMMWLEDGRRWVISRDDLEVTFKLYSSEISPHLSHWSQQWQCETVDGSWDDAKTVFASICYDVQDNDCDIFIDAGDYLSEVFTPQGTLHWPLTETVSPWYYNERYGLYLYTIEDWFWVVGTSVGSHSSVLSLENAASSPDLILPQEWDLLDGSSSVNTVIASLCGICSRVEISGTTQHSEEINGVYNFKSFDPPVFLNEDRSVVLYGSYENSREETLWIFFRFDENGDIEYLSVPVKYALWPNEVIYWSSVFGGIISYEDDLQVNCVGDGRMSSETFCDETFGYELFEAQSYWSEGNCTSSDFETCHSLCEIDETCVNFVWNTLTDECCTNDIEPTDVFEMRYTCMYSKKLKGIEEEETFVREEEELFDIEEVFEFEEEELIETEGQEISEIGGHTEAGGILDMEEGLSPSVRQCLFDAKSESNRDNLLCSTIGERYLDSTLSDDVCNFGSFSTFEAASNACCECHECTGVVSDINGQSYWIGGGKRVHATGLSTTLFAESVPVLMEVCLSHGETCQSLFFGSLSRYSCDGEPDAFCVDSRFDEDFIIYVPFGHVCYYNDFDSFATMLSIGDPAYMYKDDITRYFFANHTGVYTGTSSSSLNTQLSTNKVVLDIDTMIATNLGGFTSMTETDAVLKVRYSTPFGSND